MTLKSGYDYSNLFGTSMNGKDNICIDFDIATSVSFGELRFTLPESTVVSGVFVDAHESLIIELDSVDVQV